MTEDTAIGTLKQRVIAACLLRNCSAVWEIVEAQVAINTALELRIAELGSTNYRECLSQDDGFRAKEGLAYCNGEMANCLDKVDEQAKRIAELEEDVVWLESAYDDLRKAVVTFAAVPPAELSRTNAYSALLDALYPPDAQVTFAASEDDRP